MRTGRITGLCLTLLIMSMLCLALAAAAIRPISAWTSGTDTGARRFIATRLVLLTSPNPDPRQPTNTMRAWMVALDHTVGEYISRLQQGSTAPQRGIFTRS